MRRIPFALWLLPALVSLPLVGGPLLDTPALFKVSLVAAMLAVPSMIVVARYRSHPDPSDTEIVRRRLAVSGVVVVTVFAVVWMVGSVDHETRVTLELVAVGGGETARFDLSARPPAGGLLRDVVTVGGSVKAFFPSPDDPSRYRLSLWEEATVDDIDLVVTWRLPIWRSVGEVTISIEAVAPDDVE